MIERLEIDQIFNFSVANNFISEEYDEDFFWLNLFVNRPAFSDGIVVFLNSVKTTLVLEGGVGSGKTTFLKFLFERKKIAPAIFVDFRDIVFEQDFLERGGAYRRVHGMLKSVFLKVLLNYYSVAGIEDSLSFDPIFLIRENKNLKGNFIKPIARLLADVFFELPFGEITLGFIRYFHKGHTENKKQLEDALIEAGDLFDLLEKLEPHHLINLIRIKNNSLQPLTLIIDHIDILHSEQGEDLYEIVMAFIHRANAYGTEIYRHLLPIKVLISKRADFLVRKEYENRLYVGSYKNDIVSLHAPAISVEYEFIRHVIHKRIDLVKRNMSASGLGNYAQWSAIGLILDYLANDVKIIGQYNLRSIFNGSISKGLFFIRDILILCIETGSKSGDFLNKIELESYIIELFFKNYYENGNGLVACHLYLDTNYYNEYLVTYDNFISFLQKVGIDFLSDETTKKGSFIKNFFGSIRTFFTSAEFKNKLEDVEHLLNNATTNKYQSEIDKNQAEAAAALINSASSSENFVAQIGSVIVLKWKDSQGKQNLITKTLTRNQMIELNKNPQLLDMPLLLLERISENQQDTYLSQ